MGRKDALNSFAGIPRIVMEHPDYINLGGHAVKLLNLFAYQYRGKNNGDLCAAWAIAKKHGFKSQATLSRAKNELIHAELIIQTRQGVFLNPGGRCALYALTWQPVNECPGKNMDIEPTIKPPRQFGLERFKNRNPTSITV
jgi:hypothetical protein